MKITHATGDYFRARSRNPNITDWIRFKIKPTTHRYYEEDTKSWCVHQDHLMDLIRVSMHYVNGVDYSELDLNTQMAIAAQKAAWRTRTKLAPVPEEEDPYIVMHLLPSAPQAIIDATYKALAKLHHPDVGGDAEEFKRINAAYKRIKARNNAP